MKIAGELIKESDHASQVEHMLFRPLHCNQRGKARGTSESSPIRCLPWSALTPAGLIQGRMHCVGNAVVSHLLFAHDLHVFGPSLSGFQRLLNICADYAAEHKIVFKCNKTVGVVLPPNKVEQPKTAVVYR